MSKIRSFLTEFDDCELAYFSKFKLSTYLPDTQKEIKNYLTERVINQAKIDRLIRENSKSKLNDKKLRCTRCYSDKIRIHNVDWTETADGFALESDIAILDGLNGKITIKNEVICNVCGFWLKDPNKEKKRPYWTKIADLITSFFFNSQ